MIADENDPKSRAMLIVLNSINASLVQNTQTVRDLHIKFETHLTNYSDHTASEAELVNRGKGAWKILAWVLGAAQTLLVALFIGVQSDLSKLHTAHQNSLLANARIDARILNLEKH